MLNRKIDTRPILQRVVKSTPALWQYGGKGFAGVMANIKRPDGTNAPYADKPDYTLPPKQPGLALVMAHYGTDTARTTAHCDALAIIRQSRPMPAKVIIVEAVDAGGEASFADVEGIEHIRLELDKRSDGMWQKEALWTIGANHAFADPGISTVVWLDMDTTFTDPAWAKRVMDTIGDGEFGQPADAFYYADQPDAAKYGLSGLLEGCASRAVRGVKGGFPGLNWATTRDFYFNRLGGRLPTLSGGSGDSWLWTIMRGEKEMEGERFYSMTKPLRNGMKPRPRFFTAGLLAVHHYHGMMTSRTYGARRVIPRAAAPAPGEDVAYREDGVAIWPDSAGGRIMAKAVPEYLTLVKDKDKRGRPVAQIEARQIYDRHALDEYGAIDDKNPLIIATVLRSGGIYTPAHVKWLKAQFEQHCKAPFTFVCLSDTAIEGIDTIPLVTDVSRAGDTLCQVEYYRKGLFPASASVLCTDLDTVVFGDFTPHQCPKDSFYMGREVNNWYKSVWAVWNGGLTYFRGDFSFVYDTFTRDVARGGQHTPGWQAIGTQEFITGALKEYGVYPLDIEAHVCTRFYNGNPDTIPSCTQILQFPGSPKPWDLSPRPAWCPPLQESQCKP
jgi:hypothetical protein